MAIGMAIACMKKQTCSENIKKAINQLFPSQPGLPIGPISPNAPDAPFKPLGDEQDASQVFTHP